MTSKPHPWVKRSRELRENIPSGDLQFVRYDHGGGRMSRTDGKSRHLIANFYDEANRELLHLHYCSAERVEAVVEAAWNVFPVQPRIMEDVPELMTLFTELRELRALAEGVEDDG